MIKITVKEICELSEINRATFYKYYCDPYDLLEKLENEFLEELEDNVSQSIHNGFHEAFTYILISIKAEGELYKTLFSENGDPRLENGMMEPVSEVADFADKLVQSTLQSI